MVSQVQTILFAKWVIPIDSHRSILHDHAVVIDNHKIISICPNDQAKRKYQSKNCFYLNEHAVMPGLINSHTHAAMTLLRGVADDIPLKPWLEEHIWPIEQQFVDRDFVRLGSELAIIEMIQSGTTCFNDMYFFPDVVAQTAEKIGIRASIGMIMLDFPTAWGNGPEDYFSKGLKLIDEIKNSSLICATFSPHAPYTVGDDSLEKIRIYAEELELPIHMHVHETQFETQQSIDQFGVRPIERLKKLGLISPRLLAVHMTQLTDDEITSCAEHGVNIIHCPQANLKLASGVSPIKDCSDKGINIAIGTDGTASNNNLNILGEIRTAALLAKGISLDAQAIDAWQALEMATINGAKALNIDSICGSLAVGKSADVIAIDLSAPHCQPVYSPVSQIVYSASSSQVTHSWVAGKQLMNDRNLVNLDINNILDEVKFVGEKIAKFKN